MAFRYQPHSSAPAAPEKPRTACQGVSGQAGAGRRTEPLGAVEGVFRAQGRTVKGGIGSGRDSR
jgi:hypothetical protein